MRQLLTAATLFAFPLTLVVTAAGCSGDASSSAGPSAASGDAGTLYTRLGGHAGIRGALNAVVQAELGDPAIASYFFNQVASPVPAGHPNVDQLTECLTDMLAQAAQGPETYPGTVMDDAGASFTCRDMVTIHQPLNISGGTFDQFVMIAATELGKLHVAAADINTIGTVLNSTKIAIVSAPLLDAGEIPYAPTAVDAGDQ